MMDPMNQSHLPAFDPGETSTVSARWKKWKRSFQIFLDVNNVNIPARKKSYLLHFVGQQVQDVYFGLQGDEEPVAPQGSDVYEEAVKLLDNYFLPMKCLPLERHKFRNLEQASDEPIEKFVLRLREQGNLCEYGDHLEEEIKEQLFERGNSDDLRAKILSKSQMTLAETVEVGRSLETIGKHRQSLKLNAMPVEVNKLNKISSKVKANVKNECYRCGRVGHFANDESCPAKDRKCERCGLVGHFKKRCNTNPQKQKGRGDKRLRQVMTDMRVADSDDSDDTGNNSEDSDEEVQYLFATDPDKGEKVVCEVGGVKIEWVVDSGAGVNVITRQAWDFLKKQKVRVTYQSTSVKKPLKAYGGHPIEVAGMFSTTVATKNNITEAEIFVVEKGSCCLLGRKTAKALGILSINTSVWSVKRDEGERIGKIIGAVAEIQINPTVRPVQQTQCHIPIPLREKTEREIRRLLDQDVIEEAPRDSPWISRLVVRPKPGDTSEVRLCVDMRDANKAIIPQHYPLPTFDSIIPHLNNCKWFSKIDLNKAFHQVELAEGSRAITTFAAHNGYYRYKRLMFGMNCASEVFQCIMERILTGLPGVKPFIDDVLVFAATKKEHDIILKAVLDRLESCGATINRQKYDKKDLDVFNYVYSLTPHPATGRSPAELAFGRQFKDWIPQISAKHSVQDETVRDRDHAYRAAAKERYDKAHNTRESTLAEGDVVLMKNLVKQNKLSPTFLPAPARVIKKEGNSILVETPEGVQYRRNTSHVKKVPNNSIVATNGRDMENEEDLDEETEADWATPRNIQTSPLQASNGQSTMGRPTRHVRRPLRYDDYVMDLGA
nr:uncharacterized protein K02A2.6-like [Aedes albopictus]